MANIPKKPQKGDRVLQSLYNTVCDIVDYLPSLNVVGDNKTTYVNHSTGGTTIHAIQPNTNTQGGKTYEAGSGLTLSGNVFNNDVTSGRFIEVTSAYAINCTLSGGRDIQITQGGIINYTGEGGGGASGYTYTGDGDLGSGHIFVDYSYTNPVICSNLRYIDDLLNYSISGDAIGSELHFVQIRDIKDGAGTQVDYHWNSIGDSTEEGGQLIKFIDGVCVNLNVSGGTYITTKFHQGVGYGDYTSASIDCNLSGTYDWYPHTSGFIAIVPQYDLNQNITGGIISTNLHAGSGIAIDPQTGEITCTIEGGGGTTIIFKAPDFAKLQVTNDAGEQALGLGNTYLVPVSNGSTVRYEADGGTIIARWAPVEGSNENAFDVTTTNQSTPDDGYVRISVIDDGTLDYGCVRLYVDNKALPLHKFAKFNYSSGAIYEAGRYTTIQETSTRINAQTELEEEYTLEKPIINNMLTGGTWITIQQTETVGGVEQELEYPRINCDLSEGTNIQITTGGVINCTLSGDNSTVFINDGVISARATSPNWTSLTPSLLSVDNNNHTLSAATQSGGGGGTGGGAGWPKWENMCGSGHLVYVQQWYTTQDGGWLRISNKEDTTYGGCNSLYIDPVVPPAGVEGKNHIGLGTGRVSFFIPVPPGSSFWIGLNQGAQCWFDGTTTPPTHTTEDAILPQQIRDNSTSAVAACSVASSKCSEAESNANSMKNDYEGYVGQDNLYDPQWYKDHYYATIDNSNEATAAKNSCISYANACQTAYNSYDRPDKANYTQYVTDANNAVTDATSYATSAATQIDVASQYYDLAYDYWQAHHPQWFVENPDYTKYNQ